MLSPGDVDILSKACIAATIIQVPVRQARIEIHILVDMYRNIQNVRVVVECMLHTVSMMYVPVQYKYLAALIRKIVLANPGSNRDIVEDTKT